MRKIFTFLITLSLIAACNPVTIEFPLVYTDEAPNPEFALKLKQVLEEEYNVHIRLVEVSKIQDVLDSMTSTSLDMGLVENFVDQEGIQSVIPVYPKILHLFHRENPGSTTDIKSLFHDKRVYIGREGTASYYFMMNFWEFYGVDPSRVEVAPGMNQECDVIAIFSVLLSAEELQAFEGYSLFSLDDPNLLESNQSAVQGMALIHPQVEPYVLPARTYGDFTPNPIVTISTDMMFVVNQRMGWFAVNDLINSMFEQREQFVQLHPSFYDGITEDFDRSRLGFPLHEGARDFLDRDEPGFFERYAELGGVLFSVLVAVVSGLISLTRWRSQKKKDKVDEFYAHLIEVKQGLPQITTVIQAKEKIREIKSMQDRAFAMLMKEELSADESFRIYMELAKETLRDMQIRLKLLKGRSAKSD